MKMMMQLSNRFSRQHMRIFIENPSKTSWLHRNENIKNKAVINRTNHILKCSLILSSDIFTVFTVDHIITYSVEVNARGWRPYRNDIVAPNRFTFPSDVSSTLSRRWKIVLATTSKRAAHSTEVNISIRIFINMRTDDEWTNGSTEIERMFGVDRLRSVRLAGWDVW